MIKDWSRFSRNTSRAVWKYFHLKHKDQIKSVVKATSEALNDVEAFSDGFVVDLTSPEIESLGDGTNINEDIAFQVRILYFFSSVLVFIGVVYGSYKCLYNLTRHHVFESS